MAPSKIFIVPYRNRSNQKTHFMIYMKYILEDIPATDYEIFFVHQCDKRPFNRGGMKNIGFLAMKNKYPNDYKNITFIFNDVDTIPCKKTTLNYDTKSGIVKHFYGFTYALGGIFSIKGADFERSNGFPGLWGWGIEDNAMQDRVLNAQLKIDRSNFFGIGAPQIMQVLDKPYRLIANKDPERKKCGDGLNSIKNLKYVIENEYVQVLNFTNSIPIQNEKFYTRDISLPDGNRPYIDLLGNIEKNNKMKRWKIF